MAKATPHASLAARRVRRRLRGLTARLSRACRRPLGLRIARRRGARESLPAKFTTGIGDGIDLEEKHRGWPGVLSGCRPAADATARPLDQGWTGSWHSPLRWRCSRDRGESPGRCLRWGVGTPSRSLARTLEGSSDRGEPRRVAYEGGLSRASASLRPASTRRPRWPSPGCGARPAA